MSDSSDSGHRAVSRCLVPAQVTGEEDNENPPEQGLGVGSGTGWSAVRPVTATSGTGWPWETQSLQGPRGLRCHRVRNRTQKAW